MPTRGSGNFSARTDSRNCSEPKVPVVKEKEKVRKRRLTIGAMIIGEMVTGIRTIMLALLAILSKIVSEEVWTSSIRVPSR